ERVGRLPTSGPPAPAPDRPRDAYTGTPACRSSPRPTSYPLQPAPSITITAPGLARRRVVALSPAALGASSESNLWVGGAIRGSRTRADSIHNALDLAGGR